jgi:hypothetical protein
MFSYSPGRNFYCNINSTITKCLRRVDEFTSCFILDAISASVAVIFIVRGNVEKNELASAAGGPLVMILSCDTFSRCVISCRPHSLIGLLAKVTPS